MRPVHKQGTWLQRSGLICVLLVSVCACGHTEPQPPAAAPDAGAARTPVEPESPEQRATRLLRKVPLIDGHNDMPGQLRQRGEGHLDRVDLRTDTSQLTPPMHTDLERLRRGGLGAQFWSVYIPITERGGSAGDARMVLEQIDLTRRLVDRYADRLELALRADDIVRIHGAGKLASLIGMEGGHSIENSLAALRATYALGARYMTLTHTKSLQWADSATDEPGVHGLSAFGREVVREMNRLGMLVDLSHVSAETMHAALDTSEAPVIFSHSSAFERCRHVRNVPDDVLRKLAKNGGVVMVTFLGSYVSEPLRLWVEAQKAEQQRLAASPKTSERDVRTGVEAWTKEHPAPKATLSEVADHIDHVRAVAGIDHVGIGSDFDGTASLPVGLEDVSKYPALLYELMRRGYRDDELEKLMGLNVLRALRAAEQVAARLQKERGPSEARIEELDPRPPSVPRIWP